MRTVGLVAAALLSLLAAPTADATSIARVTLAEMTRTATVVFTGRVESVTDDGRLTRFRFADVRFYRGGPSRTVAISPMELPGLELGLRQGKRYLVFAERRRLHRGPERLLPSGYYQGIYRETNGSAQNEANGRIRLEALPRTLDRVMSPCGRVQRTAVYFIRARKVVPVVRGPAGRDPELAVWQLFRGPTRRDREAGFETSIPARTLRDVRIAGGVATVDVTRAFPIVASEHAHLAHAQLVYTLTRFPHIRLVRVLVGRKPTLVSVGGAPATIAPPVPRRNFAATAARILVESPVAHQAIESPLCVRGNAVAGGEAIELELQDSSGRVLARSVARLEEGSRGNRRSFSTSFRYRGAAARLLAFERAADGSRQNVVSVALAGR